MSETTIGLLHPGEMGAAVGKCLAGAGHRVLWAPEGRGAATKERAEEAGLTRQGPDRWMPHWARRLQARPEPSRDGKSCS